MTKKRVAIICGGRSSEHPISCISARGVLSAIDRNKFEPILIGITEKAPGLNFRAPQISLQVAMDFHMFPKVRHQ